MTDRSPTDSLEQLASLPTLAHPTVAPDGREVAVYYDRTGRNELYSIDIETGERTQWSDGEVPRNARWFLEWGADGDSVYFHLDEGGDEQNDIYAIDRSGAVEPIVELEGQVTVLDVDSDGDQLLVGSNADGQMNVYRHRAGETTKLTEYDRAVWTAVLSPDGSRFAYATNETDDYDNRDVYIADIDGSNARNLELGAVGAESTPIDWGPEGDRLLVSDNTTDLGRIGVYDVDSDEVTWLGDGTYEESGEAFMPDGNRVIGVRHRNAETIPVVYDLETGEATECELTGGVASFGMAGTSVVDDDRVVLTWTTPTTRPELLVYDIETHETETLVEPEYGPFEPADFADATYFTVESDGIPETRQAAVEHGPYDELEIEALFYDAGVRPSPLIVNPHGGPRSRDTKSFDLYTQVLASLGYSVLQVNYRGSTGRGRAFVEELIEDWGGAEQGDVVVAAEHVLDTYDWLDDDRVVVFGGSYGGYSAYWQLVQYPDFYDAGIAWIGLTDLEDMFENTMPHYRTELMEKYLGTPAENPDLYTERSPVTHIETLAAPLCIVHGVNDRRVPVSQARIVRQALDDAGYEQEADYEYHELGEEGHASSDQAQKLRTFELLADFLDRHTGTERTELAAAADD